MKSNWRFRKNVKTCPQNKKSYLMLLQDITIFIDFSFACRYGRVTTATCKYYFPLVVSFTIIKCCKELHLKCGWAPIFIFENVVMHKNQSFFLCYHYLIIVFSLSLFTIWWSIFDQPFRRSRWIQSMVIKVKITCKRVNFIQK